MIDFKKNIKYHLYVDYNSTGCRGKCQDDYCRCSEIINVRINANHLDVFHAMVDYEETITNYCLDRIFAHYLKEVDIWDFDVRISQGYYGEELDGIYLNNSTLVKSIEEFQKLQSDQERIEFVLTLEYGFLLEDAKGLNWSIEEISREEIRLPNQDYSRKLDPPTIKSYTEYYHPVGVFIGDRLIDGYHRTTAFLQGNGKKAKIIRGTP